MNDGAESIVIILYNLFCTILIPTVVVLTGIWPIETESDFAYGRMGGLPIGALIVFVPEVVFGLKCRMNRIFTIVCSGVWFGFLAKMANYFFTVVTAAPITYYSTIGVMLLGLIWSVIIEWNPELKEHILDFPQDQWLVPCSKNSKYIGVFRFIWLMAVISGTIFTLSIKWRLW